MSEPARPEPGGERPSLEKPIRASDGEREQVAEVVRRAVGDGRLTLVEGDERLAGVYATVHRSELAPFTADLGEAPVAAPGTTPARPVAAVDRAGTTSSVAVMIGATRRGDWSPGHTHVAVALMGGVELSLRDARLDDAGLTIGAVAIMGGVEIDLRGADLRGGVTIRAFALMGGVEVVVDPDTRVEAHGVGFMGGFDDSSGVPARPDGPVVRVTGFAMMGGVSVERRRPGVDGEGRPELPDRDEPGPRGVHGGH